MFFRTARRSVSTHPCFLNGRRYVSYTSSAKECLRTGYEGRSSKSRFVDALTPVDKQFLFPDLEKSLDNARADRSASYSSRTLIEYARDWAHFERYAKIRGVDPLPADPTFVALFASDHIRGLDGDPTSKGYPKPRSVSTLERRIAAISWKHKENNLTSPTAHIDVQRQLSGIRRTFSAPPGRKTPLRVGQRNELLEKLNETHSLESQRNQAILACGFATALRRSELVALTVSDIQFDESGMLVRPKRRKNDTTGTKRPIAVPYGSRPEHCAVRLLAKWVKQADITEGPLFRRIFKDAIQPEAISDRYVARLIQKLTGAADFKGDFAAHSLRRGFMTEGARAGIPLERLLQVSGHASYDQARKYIDDALAFESPPLLEIDQTAPNNQKQMQQK